jgi:Tol biopolymer transport system component
MISPDGRFVAFESDASDLVPQDTNAASDVFVRDRLTGTTERVSFDSLGQEGNLGSFGGTISPDGRYVAFVSLADNLVPGDTNGTSDFFVHDRQTGTTERVNVDSSGVQANDSTYGSVSISADGRFIAFPSHASNLVPGDTNQIPDVFVRDRLMGVTERVSVDSNGAQAIPFLINEQFSCGMSSDGRYVAFVSEAVNLVPGDTNGGADVFVHDRLTHVTERVSVSSTGQQQDGACGCWDQGLFCFISADGRFVTFTSEATNLAPGDANAGLPGLHHDVFIHDRQTGATEQVSVNSRGRGGNAISLGGWVSADGRFVTFGGASTNLVAGDTNGVSDLFLRDRLLGTTERVNLGWDGTPSNDEPWGASISQDGRYVMFSGGSDSIVPGDTNAASDAFVRDRYGGTNFTSMCDPGIAGVVGCSCSNPPSGPGRGCDNSAGTGGAILSASGGTFLSSDSLVFTTQGELPTALSLVLQGNASITAGVVFGQGVRCVGGALKRLYTKFASAGGLAAPDFGAGDSSVSATSAAKGDVILIGQSRWYFVYYRDPVVLGGCPATSTFNATQTGVVSWSP